MNLKCRILIKIRDNDIESLETLGKLGYRYTYAFCFSNNHEVNDVLRKYSDDKPITLDGTFRTPNPSYSSLIYVPFKP